MVSETEWTEIAERGGLSVELSQGVIEDLFLKGYSEEAVANNRQITSRKVEIIQTEYLRFLRGI